MMKFFKYFIILAMIFLWRDVLSQPAILFSKCYGSNSADGPKSIIMTSDHGYLIIGSAGGNGGDVTGFHGTLVDAWVVKIDSMGNLQWQKCLGGTWFDNGEKGIETNDGYIIACNGGSFDGDQSGNHGRSDFWIVKLDFGGNIVWEYSYGGNDSEVVYGLSLTRDGGLIVSGRTSSVDNGDVQGSYYAGGPVGDAWIIKLDSLGILQWQKCVGGTGTDQYGSSVVDSFGNIYMIPMPGSHDGDVTCANNAISGGWLVKLDSTGRVLWDKCYGGSGGGTLYSISLKEDKLLMSGMTTSSDGDLSHLYGYTDAWILVTDTAGNKLLSDSYGGSLTDQFLDARFTQDNKIIAGGYTNSNDHDVTLRHSPADCWLVCVDMAGNLIWENTFGGSAQERIESLIILQDGRIAFTAWTTTNNNGDVSGAHWTDEIWFVMLDNLNSINATEEVNKVKIFPQPFSDNFTIQTPVSSTFSNAGTVFSLFDILGNQIGIKTQANENTIQVNVNKDISPGMYFLKIESDSIRYVRRLVKL